MKEFTYRLQSKTETVSGPAEEDVQISLQFQPEGVEGASVFGLTLNPIEAAKFVTGRRYVVELRELGEITDES